MDFQYRIKFDGDLYRNNNYIGVRSFILTGAPYKSGIYNGFAY